MELRVCTPLNELQVLKASASPVVADVMDLVAGRDRTYGERPDQAMHVPRLLLRSFLKAVSDSSVAFLARAPGPLITLANSN